MLTSSNGQQLSYAQLSKGIGSPKASRAVGTALASNRIAYLYPLPFKMLCSVTSSDTKARRNMNTMAGPYRVLQRRIGFRASDPQGKL